MGTLKALRGVTKTGTTRCAKQCNLVLQAASRVGHLCSRSTNDKPRLKAGLCDTVLDRASGQKKRVNGFERVDIHVGNVQAHRPNGINRVDFLR